MKKKKKARVQSKTKLKTSKDTGINTGGGKNPLQHTGNLHTDPQQPRLMCSFDNWVDFLQIADHL